MRQTTLVAAALIAVTATVSAGDAAAQSQAHLGHVGDSWSGTPDDVGLLTAAQMEAEVAEQHAGLAADSDDLARIKAHTGHVMHAIDPSSVEGGPGKGYGLLRAANGTARHIQMAGEAEDATGAARTHSAHVQTAAQNVVTWAESVMELSAQVMATDDLATARDLAGQIHAATQAMLNGVDANGDGRVGWQEGEGGLAQAAQHYGLISG